MTLTVVDSLVLGTVDSTALKSARLSVRDVRWQRAEYWNGDSYIQLPPAGTGAADVVVPGWIDGSSLPVGSAVLLGLTSPTDWGDGIEHRQLRFVATTDGQVLDLGVSSLARLNAFVTESLPTGRSGATRTETIIELLEDAGRRNEAGNRGEPAPTAGPIARAERAERLGSAGADAESAAFRDQDRQYRQLPQVESEVPDLASILGKPVVAGGIALFVPRGTTPPALLIVRFLGDGLVGPVRMNAPRGYGTVTGVLPTKGIVELVEIDPTDPKKETRLGRWTLPAWPTDVADPRLMMTADGSGVWKLRIVPRTMLDDEVARRAGK